MGNFNNKIKNKLTIQLNINSRNLLVIIIFLNMFFIVTTILHNSPPLFAQHHGAPPPMANLGDRNISMNLVIEPNRLVSGQDAQLTLHLKDEKTDQIIQHVTYRTTISKDDRLKLSEFFHSHTGDLRILV